MKEKAQVKNCKVGKTFNVEGVKIEHPLFPICGSGIVSMHWCHEETGPFAEGYAHLCTDINRQELICHNINCENMEPEK